MLGGVVGWAMVQYPGASEERPLVLAVAVIFPKWSRKLRGLSAWDGVRDYVAWGGREIRRKASLSLIRRRAVGHILERGEGAEFGGFQLYALPGPAV